MPGMRQTAEDHAFLPKTHAHAKLPAAQIG
jgi:hypothetical protein